MATKLARNLRGYPNMRYSATLGILLAESKGKEGPPWAERHFSYAFTGLPPVEVYAAAGLL